MKKSFCAHNMSLKKMQSQVISTKHIYHDTNISDKWILKYQTMNYTLPCNPFIKVSGGSSLRSFKENFCKRKIYGNARVQTALKILLLEITVQQQCH